MKSSLRIWESQKRKNTLILGYYKNSIDKKWRWDGIFIVYCVKREREREKKVIQMEEKKKKLINKLGKVKLVCKKKR